MNESSESTNAGADLSVLVSVDNHGSDGGHGAVRGNADADADDDDDDNDDGDDNAGAEANDGNAGAEGDEADDGNAGKQAGGGCPMQVPCGQPYPYDAPYLPTGLTTPYTSAQQLQNMHR